MANDSGGSGFSGLVAGLLIAAILVVGGYFIYTNGGFGQTHTAEINVNIPNPTNDSGS